MSVSPADFAAALRQHPAGVALMTVRDDTDDVGTTVTSVMSVSADPPLVAVGLAADGYPAEVLEAVGSCALTVLAAGQAILASRFSSAGRPGARHLLESVPWSRAPGSEAIVLDGGVVALDCRVDRLVPAGDHVLALLRVVGVPVLREDAAPLLRLRGRYVDAPAS
ncbi:flavin reductase (DIM6/NTAB) family NADH-FMN oxidoreductase RutF [Geodermatophilus tzadiensis]|uniref:Flavin reductase (DIM6/NTAB) family NADH-FMN oxidoreductase RutF n=1 Tax=Geodermatophilus tzadiensis TaxID=1137988 RepID=A0A2T0U0F6_9ACTN|nr:flavin reductase family protein [Geodermatophilus tzadiensis]PRY51318.1 flavin reductase (DIM6/NTAB) family NADH-FMN oxidoreductase RutF [Geodermatophilus tzadiensis]